MPSKHPKTHKPRTAPPPSAAQALATFELALALHQQGRLAEARQHYEEVLAVLPGHFDALHLLGVIAAQTNDNRRAVELIGKAIAIYPGQRRLLLQPRQRIAGPWAVRRRRREL